MKLILCLLVFAIPILHFDYEESVQEVEMIIQNGTYQEDTGTLSFDISFKNNSSHPVFLDKITAAKIAGHGRSDFSKKIGASQKSYVVKIIKQGGCATPKSYKSAQQEVKLGYFSKYDLLELAPNQTSKSRKIELYFDTYFCADASYSLQLVYNPQYEALSKEEEKNLLEFHQQYDAAVKEAKEYMLQEDLLKSVWKEDASFMKYLIENINPNIKKLSPMKIESELIKLNKK